MHFHFTHTHTLKHIHAERETERHTPHVKQTPLLSNAAVLSALSISLYFFSVAGRDRYFQQELFNWDDMPVWVARLDIGTGLSADNE